MHDLSQAAEPNVEVPQRRLRTSTTERILGVAEKLLQTDGERFTLQEVAVAARVSLSSIYTRYPSKEELVHAVQVRVLASMLEQLEVGLSRIEGEGSDIRWAVSRVVDLYIDAHSQRSELIQTFHAASRSNHVLHDTGRDAFINLSRRAAEIILRANKSPMSDERVDRANSCIQMFLYALNSFLGFEHGPSADNKSTWTAFRATSVRMIVNDIIAA
jgi:AcrR family transcriptional regulator